MTAKKNEARPIVTAVGTMTTTVNDLVVAVAAVAVVTTVAVAIVAAVCVLFSPLFLMKTMMMMPDLAVAVNDECGWIRISSLHSIIDCFC